VLLSLHRLFEIMHGYIIAYTTKEMQDHALCYTPNNYCCHLKITLFLLLLSCYVSDSDIAATAMYPIDNPS